MKTYLVGGAVRDGLLGLPVTERDWLVTGADASELARLGYRRVGREFPVFLHPQTREEYALPRGSGGPVESEHALVERDLCHRDLTINAMALAPDDSLIDPLGGKQDLENRMLRHTPAFREDPIRVLRLARFAARYRGLGFQVAPETLQLVRRMVREGDLDQTVPERVFAEMERAMKGPEPWTFIQVLRDTGALAVLLPEIDRLFGIPQPAQYHPEIDTGIHSLMVLQQACRLSSRPEVRFAALLHDVGKGLTPPAEWPRHIAHEARGVPVIVSLAERLRLPGRWRELAVATCRHHLDCHRVRELRPASILKLLTSLDALRKPERLHDFLDVCEADMCGRKGFEHKDYPQRRFLLGAHEAVRDIDIPTLIGVETNTRRIAERIRRARVQAISTLKQSLQ